MTKIIVTKGLLGSYTATVNGKTFGEGLQLSSEELVINALSTLGVEVVYKTRYIDPRDRSTWRHVEISNMTGKKETLGVTE